MGRDIQDAEIVDAETGEISDGAGVALVQHEQPTAAARRMVGGLLKPVGDVGEIVRGRQEIRTLVAKSLEEGRDFGTIPGTTTPSLWQPGADTMCATFGLAPRFRVVEAEVDHDRQVRWTKSKWTGSQGNRRKKVVEGTSIGLYRYVVECQLIHRASGVVVGHGIGSCSSLESKYVDRPRDLENTILKMGKKRAHVDAVLTTLGMHDMFDPDVRDSTEAGEKADATASRPAGPDLRDALEELARDEHCPPEIGTFINKWLAKGDALTVEKAEWTLERAREKMGEADEDEEAVRAASSSTEVLHDGLPRARERGEEAGASAVRVGAAGGLPGLRRSPSDRRGRLPGL